jgi:hypothetical protein
MATLAIIRCPKRITATNPKVYLSGHSLVSAGFGGGVVTVWGPFAAN